MKILYTLLGIGLPLFFLLLSSRATAQTPTDALMMDGGQICWAAIYQHDSWDEYWEGTLKRGNGNVGTLTRQTILPMFSLGLTNKINFLAALPWMHTEASAGQVTGASGFQDWGVWLKGEALRLQAGPSQLTLHVVAGLTGKASNYLADFAPFSLGMGCLDASLRGIVQFKLDQGPYVRVQSGYHLRGNATIERDYYYTTHSVYSDEVDVPNAITYGAVIGSWFLDNSFKIEATLDGLNCLSGFDIRRQDAGFPGNKMEFTKVGLGAQYYFPFVKGLGVLASGGYIISGRNVGQSTVFAGGVTYQFGIW